MTEQARFLHEPRSEQEVVCLFGALLADLEFDCVIERVGTAFPDATLRRGQEVLRVEFELYAKSFWEHGHDPQECDLLICWHDNWGGDWPFEVVELREIVERRRPGLFVATTDRPAVWDEPTFFAQGRKDQVPEQDLELVRGILRLANHHGLGPQWLSGPRGVFAVGGDRAQFFKVWSDGHIPFPFSRLEMGNQFGELASRLNQAVPTLDLQPSDASSKRKGGQLSAIFRSDAELRGFFDVWLWFRGVMPNKRMGPTRP